MVTRRFKAGCLVTVLVFVSVIVGVFLGVVLEKAIAKKRENPAFWNEAALKQLEKLHPTEAQRTRFKELVSGAVDELTVVRTETITNVQTILIRVLADLDKELTPEQHEQFEKMKPKTSDMSLDLLKKTRGKDH